MALRKEPMWEAAERVLWKYRGGVVRDPHLNLWINSQGGFVFDTDDIVRLMMSPMGGDELAERLRREYEIKPEDVAALLAIRAEVREKGDKAPVTPAAKAPPAPGRRQLSEAGERRLRAEVARIVTFLPNPGYSVDPHGCADPKVHEAVFELLMTEREEGKLRYGVQRLAGSVKFDALMAALREAEGG